MIKIKQDDFRDLAICSFRYALGRRTYITSAISSLLIDYSSELSSFTRTLIIKEIKEALYQDTAGMKCDRESWINLLNCLISYGEK